MVNLSNILLIALYAAIASADSSCGIGQQQIISGAEPDQVTVCCPGVMKAKSNNGYCCIGGTNDDCGKTTCFDDTSSCRALINVHDSNYVKEIEDAAGVKPRRPGHPDDSDATDSGSNSTSGESSLAGTTAAITINTTATSTGSPNSASPESAPATASNSQGPDSTVSNSVAATDTGAAGNNLPIMGLVVGLAAVPAIMYGL
ncbi:uncharacterized protein TrAtP1_009102 [Trichoderma atroviride]|uniref:Uncharacterized protein n=1 Tax=Hypocrea atroviridis (strain ATCC 20476 / IMI 206040) TaxID=452589 RepID=G9NYZ3_HYPAI|nr:uncharacterized protein TRIATDRAFT_309905 [Trichoderma atroviride IMI 206040]EHK44545.1 hypothetical protein TRIATDRAFT_309905 [Trichoderma atroviride IMI 206040]UKZ67944.1 hypothetical protein TrAtP1_009102 [Trichoderma atroviride]